MIRSILVAAFVVLLASTSAAQEDCDFNRAVSLATTVGDAISERLADGRMAGEDLNGPLGERVNQANAAFAENSFAEACTLYEAIIAEHRLGSTSAMPNWIVGRAAELAVEAGLAAIDCRDPVTITDRSLEVTDMILQLGMAEMPPFHIEQPERMLSVSCETDEFEIFVTIGFTDGPVGVVPLFFWFGP